MIDLIKSKYLSNHKENTLRHVEEVAMPHQWILEAYEDLGKA